jgi:hypothetical protein
MPVSQKAFKKLDDFPGKRPAGDRDRHVPSYLN